MKSSYWKPRQFLILGILVLLFLFLVDLNQRLVQLNRLTQKRDQIQAEVTALQQTIEALGTQKAYATSEAAVEAYARNQANMVKPGENPIILVPLRTAPESAGSNPTPTPSPVPPWEVWWALFFGR
ncbi:MAG: septum formation initiator family protein [Thermanaerothrix sp.]|jgi:cell division protein FtsB|uniref:Septum formation initiator family protein n=1 Tax=Thermanaerothrix solaris TaxID=3058434 RepID=A0ABU3NIR4_9CHLR|nr:septum formation initiator family protein [Thermanaerothrix sp. 4228-RoL]MDT8896750.1 septum formation initiator family protein [Thermanaerothrix sp. 4228-RoL]